MKRLGLLAVVCLALASCGSESTEVADVGELQRCLESAGLFTDSGPGVDLVAETASQGAVQVKTDTNEIQIAAGAHSEEAEAIERAYGAFEGGNVERRGTVVIAATYEASDEEMDPIDACLEKQGI